MYIIHVLCMNIYIYTYIYIYIYISTYVHIKYIYIYIYRYIGQCGPPWGSQVSAHNTPIANSIYDTLIALNGRLPGNEEADAIDGEELSQQELQELLTSEDVRDVVAVTQRWLRWRNGGGSGLKGNGWPIECHSNVVVDDVFNLV